MTKILLSKRANESLISLQFAGRRSRGSVSILLGVALPQASSEGVCAPVAWVAWFARFARLSQLFLFFHFLFFFVSIFFSLHFPFFVFVFSFCFLLFFISFCPLFFCFFFFFLEWPTTTTREGRTNPNPEKEEPLSSLLPPLRRIKGANP